MFLSYLVIRMEHEDYGKINEDEIRGYMTHIIQHSLDDQYNPKSSLIKRKKGFVLHTDKLLEAIYEDDGKCLVIANHKINLFFPEIELDNDDYNEYLDEAIEMGHYLVQLMNQILEEDSLLLANYEFVLESEKITEGFILWVGIFISKKLYTTKGFFDILLNTPVNLERWKSQCHQFMDIITTKLKRKTNWVRLPDGKEGKKTGTFTSGVKIFQFLFKKYNGKDECGHYYKLCVNNLIKFIPAIENETKNTDTILFFDKDGEERYKWLRKITDCLSSYANWYLGYNIPKSEYRLVNWGTDDGLWLVLIHKNDQKI